MLRAHARSNEIWGVLGVTPEGMVESQGFRRSWDFRDTLGWFSGGIFWSLGFKLREALGGCGSQSQEFYVP